MDLIVYNTGYLSKDDVMELCKKNVKFGIYKTYKGIDILVQVAYTVPVKAYLYLPQNDRLPYKVIEGKKITYGDLIFDSTKDNSDEIDTKDWNNGNQIMSYQDYYLTN